MKYNSKYSISLVLTTLLILGLSIFNTNTAEASPVIGEQKTLVVMVNFSNTSTPTLTKATVDDIMFNQVNAFYSENSYGQISVTGTSFGWLDVPYAKTCDRPTILSYAMEAVAPLTDITEYSHIFVTGPFESCGFAAWSSIGSTSVNTPDGVVEASTSWINSITFGPSTMMHEFGHGLGLGHANFYNCGVASLSATGCASVDYGDPFDIMASGVNHPHLNAGNRDFLGWLNSTTLSTVTESGTYTIEPIEANTLGLKAVRIPRGTNDYLYVEYRQPIGFDSGIGSNSDIFEGALFHIGQFTTNLIDATPTSSSTNSVLHVGETLVDQKTNTSVTVVEVTPEHIVVNVAVGRVDFTGPSVSVVSPIQGQEVSGTVSLEANATDPSGISKVEFYINSQLVSTASSAPYTYDWDSTLVANGAVTLQATAYDQAGVAWGQSNNFAFSPIVSFSVNNSDMVLPTVSFDTFPNPTNNPINVSATASDNVGVASVAFFLNGNLISTDTVSPYVLSQTVYPGTYTLSAQARDNAGNLSLPVSVELQVSAPTVNIVSPANGSNVTGMTNIVINTSNLSTMSQLFVNGSMAGNLMSVNGVAQRSVDFSYYPSGTIQIRSVVTEAGYTASSTIYVTKADTMPPTLSITSPTASSTVNGLVSIIASATDTSGISRVEFYVDSVLLSTDTTLPYNAVWDATNLAHNSSHSIMARAYDNVGNITIRNVSVTVVDVTLPVVSITSPTASSTVSGVVQIDATATDNTGVSRVEFYVDSVLLSTDTTSPYVATWDTTSLLHNSPHSILVKAYDVADNQSSQSISVTVSDVTAPSLSITAPLNNATVARNKNTTITATSTDISGISKVEFYVNNVLKCADTTASYSCVWAVPSARNTNYTIKAKSYDLAGNTIEKSIVVTSSR